MVMKDENCAWQRAHTFVHAFLQLIKENLASNPHMPPLLLKCPFIFFPPFEVPHTPSFSQQYQAVDRFIRNVELTPAVRERPGFHYLPKAAVADAVFEPCHRISKKCSKFLAALNRDGA